LAGQLLKRNRSDNFASGTPFSNLQIPRNVQFIKERVKMKKAGSIFLGFGLALILAGSAGAGGINNRQNWSAEYIRTLTRAAATDSADIVVYNPAGTVKMDEGFYTNFSVQYIDKVYNNKFAFQNLEQDEPSFVPGLYALYRKGPWAGFFGVNVTAGGGKLKWSDGNLISFQLGQAFAGAVNQQVNAGLPPIPGTSVDYNLFRHKVNAEGHVTGFNLGGAYQPIKWCSFSVAARLNYGQKNFNGDAVVAPTVSDPLGVLPEFTPQWANINFDQDATGWNLIFGLDFFPIENLTIGLRYETATYLNYKTDVKSDTNFGGRLLLAGLGIFDNTRDRDDIPASFVGGISYKWRRLRAEGNFFYHFNKDARIGGSTRRRLEDRVSNGWEVGLSLEYDVLQNLKASAGWLYSETGIEAKDMLTLFPELDANTFGLGVAWKINPDLDLNIALGKVFYQDESFTDPLTGLKVTYEKDINFLALGLQYKFF
jgi:long-chain fatty acid transport protein